MTHKYTVEAIKEDGIPKYAVVEWNWLPRHLLRVCFTHSHREIVWQEYLRYYHD